jgi:AcrR family transcriptional regulator
MTQAPSEATRVRILETALRLLRRHGKDKLTVVDIAKSLGMSHANVYRFFRNKTDILDTVVNEWLAKVESFVQSTARKPGTAAERIEAVVLNLHLKRRRKFVRDPEVYEAFRHLFELRPDAAQRHRQAIFDVFRQLLVEGIEAGEFRPVDVDEAAAVLKDATALFLHPILIPTLSQEPTGPRARAVVAYFLSSIAVSPVTSGGPRPVPAP